MTKKQKSTRRNKPANRPLCVSVIGAGRMGTALALTLPRDEYEVVAFVSRDGKSARRAAGMLPGGAIALGANHLNRLPPADVVLITTPDDEIEAVAKRLSRVLKTDGKRAVVIHTSGALSSEALGLLRTKGCSTGSLHPLVSISDPANGAALFASAFFCFEGDTEAKLVADSIVQRLGGKPFTITTEHKPLYHAAAVMTAGHTLALFELNAQVLKKCGLKIGQARKVLLPLLQSTVRNLAASSPAEALTGTFARGDVSTIKRHMEALSKLDERTALFVYLLLGAESISLAAIKDLGFPKLQAMRLALVNELYFCKWER